MLTPYSVIFRLLDTQSFMSSKTLLRKCAMITKGKSNFGFPFEALHCVAQGGDGALHSFSQQNGAKVHKLSVTDAKRAG